MAYKFLIALAIPGATPALCEGGVYSNDPADLLSAEDYRSNDFAEALAECDRLNADRPSPAYELRDSLDGVDATDSDVLSSLVQWQLEAVITEGMSLSNASAVFKERGRRVVDSAVAPCFVILDSAGELVDMAGDARAAAFLAGEHSRVWHKPGGNERPYQLDAIRLGSLADMETGRELIGRGEGGSESARMAEAIAAAFGRDIPDVLARELGRMSRNDGLADRYAEAMGRIERMEAREADLSAQVTEWKAEAANQDRARAAVTRECEELRRAKAKAESDCATYRQQRDAEGKRAFEAEQRAETLAAQANRSDAAWIAEHKAHESLDRATRPLMRELDGLTLSMLPPGVYGATLAAAYSEARYAFTVGTPGERAAAFMDKEAE